MKAPDRLETLVDYGVIQEVVRPLMSGKEAQVYVVLVGGEECVAKVYKTAHQRSFKHRSDYTEGRRTRNSRDQRAMNKRTVHGRKRDEDAWRNTEVDMIYRLRDAGVRVPDPINFAEGVLVMELVKDSDGHAAPRLGDLTFSALEAQEIYQELIREVVRMLCAGVIHGDLSDFNVLMSASGPVVIDFPQAIDPTHNPNGKKLLLRDVENLHRFLRRFAPSLPVMPYGEEIWSLYEKNRLTPDTKLSGRHAGPVGKAETGEVLELIEAANRDEQIRREGRFQVDDSDPRSEAHSAVAKDDSGGGGPAPLRRVVDFSAENRARRGTGRRSGSNTKKRSAASPASRSDHPVPPKGPAAEVAGKGDAVPSRTRRRRGRVRRAGAAPTPPDRGDSGSTKGQTKIQTPAAGETRRPKRPTKPHADSAGGSALADDQKVDKRRRRRRRRARKPETSV